MNRSSAFAGMLALVMLAGCNVGGFFGQALGPPPVPAEYVPRQEPMLIFCENYKDPGATYIEAEQLEQFVANQIEVHQVAPLIGAGALADVRGVHANDFAKMSVAQIGRETGATQVLYIHMVSATMDVAQASEVLKGSGAARVKLIDVATGQTLWPIETPDGRYVSVETPMARVGEAVSEASVRRDIDQALAAKIVSYLYTYKPE